MEHSCIICKEVITNPLCLDCLEMEIGQWIQEKNPNLEQEVHAISKVFADCPEVGTQCILCGKHMHVCSHCYTKEIFEWLELEYPKLKGEFVELFDFELRHLVADC